MASPADSLRVGGGKSSSVGRNSLEALGAGDAGAGDAEGGDPPPRRFTPEGGVARNEERRANLEEITRIEVIFNKRSRNLDLNSDPLV